MTQMENVNRRWLVRTGTLSAGVLLIAALLVIVNYFGDKYHKRIFPPFLISCPVEEFSDNLVGIINRIFVIRHHILPFKNRIHRYIEWFMARKGQY